MLLKRVTAKQDDAVFLGDYAPAGAHAVDPESGISGAAVASKYPAVGAVVPYVRAGVGAFCTQHWHNPQWGEKALDLLEEVVGAHQVGASFAGCVCSLA